MWAERYARAHASCCPALTRRLRSKASLAQLAALGVTRVISLGAPPALVPSLPQDACLAVPLIDDDDADLLSRLPSCLAFAERATTDGAALLIACHAGAQRAYCFTADG